MQFILAFMSLIAAVVPMFIYLLVIWWMDRNERDPFWIVFMNFFWGATGAIVLGIIGSLIFQIPLTLGIQMLFGADSAELNDLSGAIITAPLIEEFTKGMFVVIMSFSRKFDGVVDGVVYGGAIGLGFGMTENFLYFLNYGTEPMSWLYLVVIRTLFSAVMHCMSTATFGGFIGYAKFKPIGYKMFLVPLGYIAAMFLHFSWNLTVSFEETTVIGFLFLILYFFSWIAVFQIAVYMEAKSISRELQDESNRGLIPAEHLKYLPYVSRRNKYGWCPQGVNQKEYVKNSVLLALRKYQSKHLKGKTKALYDQEIEQLRYAIQMMFYNAHMNYYYKQ
ncbi:MAG: PrsW family intramembrane metalloprotease [Ignavibacteria bacterium]|nr:PrsW family intramembrane metalloprotease [Ignavibacteria bacterium]